MGHIARVFEAAGIPTVIIASRVFRPTLENMTLPRVVLTPHPMGRPLGAPGDKVRQREVILAALDLLENAQEMGTVVELAGRYLPMEVQI